MYHSHSGPQVHGWLKTVYQILGNKLIRQEVLEYSALESSSKSKAFHFCTFQPLKDEGLLITTCPQGTFPIVLLEVTWLLFNANIFSKQADPNAGISFLVKLKSLKNHSALAFAFDSHCRAD